MKMFEGLRGRKFSAKCKSRIKSTMAKIKVMRRNNEARQKILTQDIIDLLNGGFDTRAYDKASELCGEQNKGSCFDSIDKFCEILKDNLSALRKHRGCPDECKEPVSSLIFAAARMANIPELKELRDTFTEKYGDSLEDLVNQEFAERLILWRSSSWQKDMKLQLLQDIAHKSFIELDYKALVRKLFNPPPASDQDQKNEISPRREDVVKKEDDERDPSSCGRKDEDVGNGSILRLSWQWSIAVQGKSNQVFLPHETPSFPARENNGADHDLTSSERRVPEKERDLRQAFSKGLVPPPYAKPKPGQDQTKPESLPSVEEVGNQEIPTGTNSLVQGEVVEGTRAQASAEGGAKTGPRSVRTRRANPPPVQDQGVEPATRTHPSIAMLEDPKRGLQILSTMGSDEKDEEEPARLLVQHYNIGKPSCEPPPPPQTTQGEEENNEPAPALSLDQLEPTPPPGNDARRQGHLRSTSSQPDVKYNHVHPKLPDYDKIAAQFAALKRK